MGRCRRARSRSQRRRSAANPWRCLPYPWKRTSKAQKHFIPKTGGQLSTFRAIAVSCCHTIALAQRVTYSQRPVGKRRVVIHNRGAEPTMARIGTPEVAAYLDEYLEVAGFPDYPDALNGLQLSNRGTVGRVAAAVDASERAIRQAVQRGCDLLLAHHGLFWDGNQPVTGRRYRKLSVAM